MGEGLHQGSGGGVGGGRGGNLLEGDISGWEVGVAILRGLSSKNREGVQWGRGRWGEGP